MPKIVVKYFNIFVPLGVGYVLHNSFDAAVSLVIETNDSCSISKLHSQYSTARTFHRFQHFIVRIYCRLVLRVTPNLVFVEMHLVGPAGYLES